MPDFSLETYLSKGVERIVKEIIKLSVSSPGKGLFFMRYAAAEKRARLLRKSYEEKGEHIPPFLIASITSQCNLRCKGCYAQAQEGCQGSADKKDMKELTSGQWGEIFEQAGELGVSFILLAGGEPLTRREVLAEAGLHKEILFPVFTNGTLMDEEMLQLFASQHNLLPILSLEGNQEKTDARRGAGVYAQLEKTMALLAQNHILFGASVTVTTENREEVLAERFTETLKASGCKAVIYVEYVPADAATAYLALNEVQRTEMAEQLQCLRSREPELLFISFPGDEKEAGGCLAAGRGFFHINASGGAEPCPFSPYSDTDVLCVGLKEALLSPLFVSIRTGVLLKGEHSGGCVLFEKEEEVKLLWQGAVI